MLTAHELFGFMPAPLAQEILQFASEEDKDVYRLTLNAVAEARKLRPTFLERKPRVERHLDMAAMLAKPRMDLYAGNLLRAWLVKRKGALLADFLDALGIPHQQGTIDDLPATMDDQKLRAAVDLLFSKHDPAAVSVYLHAFHAMNEVTWPNFKALLENDPRLHFA